MLLSISLSPKTFELKLVRIVTFSVTAKFKVKTRSPISMSSPILTPSISDWTQDFTLHFYGSLDLLYRNGFQSEIDGVSMGDDIEIGDLGFTLNFAVTENVTVRTSFSSNVFGDSDINNSMIRLQFFYAWDRAIENLKKLGSE